MANNNICVNCENCESCTLSKKDLIYDCGEFVDHQDQISTSQSLADLRFLVITGLEAKDFQPTVMR